MSSTKCYALAFFMLCASFSDANAIAGVFANENKSEVLYGQGVHAFFDGDYRGAIRILKEVEQLGSEDPRPYYFMAISYHRTKKDALAEKMFRKAARLEWEGQSVRDYNVSDALRRIQGDERLFIEMFRNQAKIDWQKAEKKRRTVKYQKEKSVEKDVLVSLSESYVGEAPFGAKSLEPFETEDNAVKPLASDDDQPSPAAPKTAKTDEEKPGTARTQKKTDDVFDPFADPDEEEDGMMDDDEEDPFGGSSKTKKTDAADDDDEEDPFGGSSMKKTDTADDDDEEDPFGDSSDMKKTDTADDDDDEDPFGDSSNTKKTDKDDPTDDEDDPFGDP